MQAPVDEARVLERLGQDLEHDEAEQARDNEAIEYRDRTATLTGEPRDRRPDEQRNDAGDEQPHGGADLNRKGRASPTPSRRERQPW